MIDVPGLATIEHVEIERNDACRPLWSSYRHLWRRIWSGCSNSEKVVTLESTYCLSMLKSCQHHPSTKWTCTVSLTFYSLDFTDSFFFWSAGVRKVVTHHLSTDQYVCSALIRQGLMPCAPYSPTTTISIRALELFRLTHHRCPHVSVNSFVKTLCDIHVVPFKSYLLRQFAIAFDLYLSI